MNNKMIAQELLAVAKDLTAAVKPSFSAKVKGDDILLYMTVKFDNVAAKNLPRFLGDAEAIAESRLSRAAGQDDWAVKKSSWSTTNNGLQIVYLFEYGAEDSDDARQTIKILERG